MKVYLVWDFQAGQYSSPELIGIYRNREDANNRADARAGFRYQRRKRRLENGLVHYSFDEGASIFVTENQVN